MKRFALSLLFFTLMSASVFSVALYESSTLERRKGLQGCCSHHGGVAGCEDGRVVCADGTKSKTCTCEN